MICCALLAALLAPLIWLLRHLRRSESGCALAWRPYAENQSEKRTAFSPRARLKSFSYAFEGLAFMMRTQHNAWVHAGATLAVIVAGAALQARAEDWRWLVAAMSFVWVAEAVNTAFEHVCNVVSPQYSLEVKAAKDVAAGAVLLASMGAAAIGLLVFTPYLAAHF